MINLWRFLTRRTAYAQWKPHSLQGGFSMIETLLVIGIIASLSAWAAPDVRYLQNRAKVQQTAQQLRDHLELARSMAQSRQTEVNVCPIAVADLAAVMPVCLAQGVQWHAWMVYSTTQGVMTRSGLLPPSVVIDSNDSRGLIAFDAKGAAANSNATLAVSMRGMDAKSGLSTQTTPVEKIIIAPTGRIRAE
jgi:prepilin-type N-terminal cleavage/methylation domain-containing protein